MIYERIKTEADQMGLTIAELEKKSGLGNGVIGGWRIHWAFQLIICSKGKKEHRAGRVLEGYQKGARNGEVNFQSRQGSNNRR